MARPLLSSEWLPYVNQFPLDTYDRFSLHESCLDLETEASRIFSGGGDIESWTREENGQGIKEFYEPVPRITNDFPVTISSMDEVGLNPGTRKASSTDVFGLSQDRIETSKDVV